MELASGRPYVLDLGLEESMALPELGELLERKRVDRSEGGQLRFELVHPGRRVGAFRQLRPRCTDRLLGRAAELAVQGLGQRLAPDSGLHQVELGVLQAVAHGCKLLLAGRAPAPELFEAGPAGPYRLELTAVAVAERGQ